MAHPPQSARFDKIKDDEKKYVILASSNDNAFSRNFIDVTGTRKATFIKQELERSNNTVIAFEAVNIL